MTAPHPSDLPYSLECPECGDAAFMRDEDLYTDGEEEQCPCGCRVIVSVDDWDPDPAEHIAYANVLHYPDESTI